MNASDVVALYTMGLEHDITIWIDGGWGVDALLGYQSRPHKDIDIAIQARDVPLFRSLMQEQHYQEIKLEIARPHNFVLGDVQGREIDVHVIVLDAHGNGIYGPVEDGAMYPADSLTGVGTIADTSVKCIAPEWMVKFHSGYTLTPKDFADVSALCEKFGIDLPAEFQHFKQQT